MTQAHKRGVPVWLKVAVSAGLLIALFAVLPWAQVRDGFLRLPAGTWVLILTGFVAGHTLGVFKWRLFVNVGRASLGFADGAMCYAAGLFANLCLPSIVGGDVLRAAMAGRITRRPEAAFLGGVLDRVTDMIAMALLVTLGALTSHAALPGWGGELLTVAVAIGVVGGAIALPAVLRRPLARWPRKLRRPVGRGLVALRRLVRDPRHAMVALALSLSIQSSFVLLNMWIGREIGIDVPVMVWFLVWPLAKLAGLMPISLGGLAVREATLAALLAPFGVPFALGVVCSLLWQTVLIAGGLLGGAFWLLMRQRRGRPDAPLPASSTRSAPNYV